MLNCEILKGLQQLDFSVFLSLLLVFALEKVELNSYNTSLVSCDSLLGKSFQGFP